MLEPVLPGVDTLKDNACMVHGDSKIIKMCTTRLLASQFHADGIRFARPTLEPVLPGTSTR